MTGERTLLHCDCNNFYASVELLAHPELRHLPVAVAGDPEGRHGIILAKNMLAKRYGVQTAETIWQARQKCPGLVLLPPHYQQYTEMSRRINQMYLDVTDQVEPFSVDESFLDVTGSRRLFGTGPEIADALRRRVREELGITISVGVSDNKTWAKMGSDYKKPDATTVITRESVGNILYPLPIEAMLYVGRSTAALLRRHGVGTVGALAHSDPLLLESYLGKSGGGLWRAANGLDDSPVKRWGETEPVKSISNSCTFSTDLVGREACFRGLLPLCDSVGTRLRSQRLKCRTVTVQVKNPALKVISRQKTLSAPTNLTRQLYREACAILESCWPVDAPVRLLAVAADNLCGEDEREPFQLSLFEDAAQDERVARLEQTIDQLRVRFGRNAVESATLKAPRKETE